MAAPGESRERNSRENPFDELEVFSTPRRIASVTGMVMNLLVYPLVSLRWEMMKNYERSGRALSSKALGRECHNGNAKGKLAKTLQLNAKLDKFVRLK